MKVKTAMLFTLTVTTVFSLAFGFGGGVVGFYVARELNKDSEVNSNSKDTLRISSEESTIIDVADKTKDSVVSIVITAEVPKYEQYYYDPFGNSGFEIPSQRQNGTEEQQIGAGSGFIISEDGMIITNRHVVDTKDASYTVIFNDGEKAEAKVLAIDTLLDIAFIKVEKDGLKPLELGSSENLKVGQTVIAIGNALGEFNNSVSSGIISGLGRQIIAGDSTGQSSELLADVIQTDASINPGNSGGPLLSSEGKVIGVNVAVAMNGENVAFAIPADYVKDLLDRLDDEGNISRPVLGVRYTLIDDQVKKENDLSVNYGAWINGTTKNPAILKNSPAEKAGLQEDDIILEVDGKKIEGTNTLQQLIQEKRIDDTVELKILRDEKEITVEVELFEFES